MGDTMVRVEAEQVGLYYGRTAIIWLKSVLYDYVVVKSRWWVAYVFLLVATYVGFGGGLECVPGRQYDVECRRDQAIRKLLVTSYTIVMLSLDA